MTISITKLGKIEKVVRKYIGSCKNCGTEIECVDTDTRYEPDGPFGQFGFRAVDCPLCNKTIAVREV